MLKQRPTIFLMSMGLFAGLLLGSAAVDQVLTTAVVAFMLLMSVWSSGQAHVATAPSKDGVMRW